MVAYSFHPRFVELIKGGKKCQTIRAPRKRHARVGETLQLYTGMRTKQCTLIREARCIDVCAVLLNFVEGVIAVGSTDDILEVCAEPHARNAFARVDGFADYDDLRGFWAKEHPGVDSFDGVLIRWAP